jgi:hypothetical protein
MNVSKRRATGLRLHLRRAALVALGIACAALAAPGCSQARRYFWRERRPGVSINHATAVRQAEVIRNAAPQKGWGF